jgi:predicted membrane channel-forming protein YqfA (hemolysin III family)
MKEEILSSSSSSISSNESNSFRKRKNTKKYRKNFIKTKSVSTDKEDILTREQVSFEFRENYILNGYRTPNTTFLLCLKSVFKINNNEAINFWTHFIPFFLIFIYLIRFSIQYNIKNDTFMWPYFIYLSTAAFYLFMSAMAHALNCLSNIARHVCFILDYLSIGVYGMGCCIAYKAYCLSAMPHYTSTFFDYYVTIAMCLTIASNICASASRFVLSYNIRSILRLMSISVLYVFNSLPLFYRLIASYFPNSVQYLSPGLKFIFSHNTTDEEIDSIKNINDESNMYFLAQLFFSIFSAILYISHIPERYYPGKFDIIGQSHQIFHITTALSTFFQIKALESDIFQLRPILNGLINSNDSIYTQISISDTISSTSINFYTYSIKYIDFLTVTLSPYFRTKLTYAFIMFCCLIFNAIILIYYYFKALYFNPWNKVNSSGDDFFRNYCNSCCFINRKTNNSINQDNKKSF